MMSSFRKLRIGVLVPENLLVTKFEYLALEHVMRLKCIESIFFAVVTVDPSKAPHRPVKRLPFLVLNRMERLFATRLLKAPNLDFRVSIDYLHNQFSFVRVRARRQKQLFDWFDQDSIATL